MRYYNEYSLYLWACQKLRKFEQLCTRYNLSSQNPYRFYNELIARHVSLKDDPEYLIFLSIVFSDTGFLFDSFASQHDQLKMLQLIQDPEFNMISKEYDNESYDQFQKSLGYLQLFIRFKNTCTLDKRLYYKKLQEYLYKHFEMSEKYLKWKNEYSKLHVPTKKDAVKISEEKLDNIYNPEDFGDPNKSTIQWYDNNFVPGKEVVLRLLEFFKEYVENMVIHEGKKREYSEISRCVTKAIRAFKNDDINEDSSDHIPSIFESIFKLICAYKPYTQIAPFYVYKLFIERAPKIGNPKKVKVNLLLTKHSDDDYFKTDCTYQEKDSLLIMSKKELYRSLCIFFSQVFLECEITDCDFDLCDYLFEKDYPCYPKLLDRNKTHISDDEGNQYRLPVPTHEFIQYDYLESTFPHQAIFLKNLSRCLSLNVDLLPLFDVLCTISKSKFEQLRNRPFDSFAKNLKLCDYSKIYYKLRRESLSVKKRKKAAEKSRKTFERDGFEQIVLLDAGGLGAPNISFAWRDKWANFLKGLDDPSYIADDREVDEDEEGFIIYAKLQFIVDSLKQEYIRKIMQFYKNVLFQTYTREQINILKKYDLDDIK